MIYLNDILICLNNMFTYCCYIKEVLKYLHKSGLYAKAKKYEFNPELVEYIG